MSFLLFCIFRLPFYSIIIMEQKNTQEQNNEIDLLELFNRMGKGIKQILLSTLQFLVSFIVYSVKKFYIYGLAIIIAGGMAYLNYSLSKQYYSSEMVAITKAIPSTDMAMYINELHVLAKDGNTSELAKQLNIDSNLAINIKDIKGFLYVDLNKDGIGDYVDYENSLDRADTTKRIISDRILVKLEVYDNHIFADLKAGIYDYLNTNEYVNKFNQLKQAQLQEMISNINEEIKKLDSLQRFEYFNNQSMNHQKRSGQLMILNEEITQLYHEEILKLQKQKQYYEQNLALFTEAITVIKDFSSLQSAENNLLAFLKKYLLATTLISLLLVLLLKYKNLLIQFTS